MERVKAFGSAPLYVACQSVAEASGIRVLCGWEPTCVEDRDSLKKVHLHYLVKNYSFDEDDDDISINEGTTNTAIIGEESDEDGMNTVDGRCKTAIEGEQGITCSFPVMFFAKYWPFSIVSKN